MFWLVRAGGLASCVWEVILASVPCCAFQRLVSSLANVSGLHPRTTSELCSARDRLARILSDIEEAKVAMGVAGTRYGCLRQAVAVVIVDSGNRSCRRRFLWRTGHALYLLRCTCLCCPYCLRRGGYDCMCRCEHRCSYRVTGAGNSRASGAGSKLGQSRTGGTSVACLWCVPAVNCRHVVT